MLAYDLHERRARVLRHLKELFACEDCHMMYPYYVMDWDHKNQDGKTQSGNWCTYSWKFILEELDKCDLVCANCHRVREHERRQSEKSAIS